MHAELAAVLNPLHDVIRANRVIAVVSWQERLIACNGQAASHTRAF